MASPAIFKGRLTKFLTNGGILIPARPQSTDASVVPTPGEIAYDTENENFVVYQDGQWEVIAVFSDLIASNIVNTPYGTITAVNVQTALNELADEKVQKAGDSMSGNLTFASNTGIESTVDASTLNIGTSSYTHNVNIASGSHVSSVNIGTGTGATTINIGGAGDTVNIGGELVYVDVSTLQVEDKDIVVNKNGAAGSGNSAGLHVEEGGVITGFNHVANSRQSWEFIAPANPGAIQLTPSVGAFVTEIKSTVTANRVITLPNTTDTLATQTQIDDLNQRIDDLTTDDVPESATPTNKYFTDTRARTAAVVNSAAGTETDQAPSVSAIVSYVNSQINALDTDDIEEGAVNKYFTDTRAKTAAVVNSTAGSQTDQAPSVSSVKTYVTGQIDALTTDAIEEGATNQYFTVERAQDAAWSALDAGTNGAGGAISVQYDDALNKLALVIGNASTTTRGAALFSPFDFDLDGSQRITIKDGGVNNSQLENSSVTLNGASISLGGSSFVGIVNATKSISGNLEANTRFFVDTSAGALVLTLPTGAANAYIELKDAKGTWDINNVTITPATGEKIDGLTINESLVCDVREGWVSLAWDVINTRWNVSTTAVVNLTQSYASASAPGLVSIENQSFGGVKTFTNGVILSPNTTPVVNPSAGLQVYAKSDNKLYTLTSTGIEQAVGSGGSVLLITQASHGFTSADVGRPLYLNGSTYALAQADTEAKAEVAGLINRIIDGNSFEVCLGGEVSSIGANLVTGAGVETVVFDSYTGQTANGITSGVGSSRYYGATFIVGTPCDVSKISVYAQTNSTAETGSIYLELYQTIPGIITDEPTGPVLATSTSISLVGLPTSTSRFFDFTFNTPVSIAAGTKYLWLMKGTGIDTNALTALVTTASISDTVTSYYDLLNYGNAPGPYWAQGFDQLFKVTALVSSALTPGEMYFLSASQAGKISTTPPSVVGQISKPVGIARTSSAIDFFNMRGSSVGGTNVYTQIGLTNNAVTTIQNASAYDSVELSGWVYINATTPLRFGIKVQVTKNGAGNNYLVSFQTSGDTPPSGFDVDATAAGLVQVTLPSIAGFTSAVVQFSLNGPAVGASLPLQIESTNVSFSAVQAKDVGGIALKDSTGTNRIVMTATGITTSAPVTLSQGIANSFSIALSGTYTASTFYAVASSANLGAGTYIAYIYMDTYIAAGVGYQWTWISVPFVMGGFATNSSDSITLPSMAGDGHARNGMNSPSVRVRQTPSADGKTYVDVSFAVTLSALDGSAGKNTVVYFKRIA